MSEKIEYGIALELARREEREACAREVENIQNIGGVVRVELPEVIRAIANLIRHGIPDFKER